MKRIITLLAFIIVGLIAACNSGPLTPPADAGKSVTQTLAPTPASTLPLQPSATSPAAKSTQPPLTATSPTAAAGAATMPSSGYSFPPPPQDIPAFLPTTRPTGYAVFTWNNLGMHCYNNDFSRMMVLPPYNTLWVQVVARTGDDPRVVGSGLTASYSIPTVKNPETHTNFWQFAAGYGFKLDVGVGLTGKKTAGTLDFQSDHFIAEGVPLVDYSDSGQYDPYPFYIIDLTDSSGQKVGTSFNVAPISSEMRCDLCHGGTSLPATSDKILAAHDKNSGTKLADQVKAGTPVFCASCHADPAMGVVANQGSKFSLSGAMHTYHADKFSRPGLPENVCQACHPGQVTQCLRDVMYAKGITCTDCHGGLAEVGDAARTPWVNLPQCSTCHGADPQQATIKHIDQANTKLTTSDTQLFRNSKAHGGGGIYCSACHGSTHAVYQTSTNRDNQYSIFFQGKAGVISDCTICHGEKPDESFWHVRSSGRN